MNGTDDNSDTDGGAPGGFNPTEDAKQRLADSVAAVLTALTEAGAAADKAGPGAAPRLVAAHRGRFAAAMNRFSEALADTLAEAPEILDPAAAAAGPLAPLIAQARELPIFRRAQQSIARDDEDHQLQRILLNGRGAWYDLPSLLLEDYFHETASARSFRSRVSAVGELLREEICRRVNGGQDEVRLLTLRCGTLAELNEVLDHPVCAAHTSITFVDHSAGALRQTRQNVGARLTLGARYLRADPLTLGDGDNRPRRPFDVALALSLFDLLPPEEVRRFTRSCSGLLNPGGALVTSGYDTSVPRGERALTFGLLGARVNYLDETGWRALLAPARFDVARARFERREPAALAVLAIKGA